MKVVIKAIEFESEDGAHAALVEVKDRNDYTVRCLHWQYGGWLLSDERVVEGYDRAEQEARKWCGGLD